MRKIFGLVGGLLVLAGSGCGGGGSSRPVFSDRQSLGRKIFFDTSLSSPPGQSCGSCHAIERAFADPISDEQPTSQGAVAGRFGSRNAPSISYAAFAPLFQFSEEEQDFIGGQFLDGRAADLKAQAHQPFFQANEMNNSTKEEVWQKLRAASYADEFRAVFGEGSLDDAELAFENATEALAEFERSPEVNPFSSKFDAFTRRQAELTEQELRGLSFFNDPKKGNCAACHPSTPSETNLPALFTDHTYDNLGAPVNFSSLFLAMPESINPQGAAFRDVGLQTTTGRPEDAGRFKVSSLRNVARTAPYFHNGVFRTLKEVVHFYNARDSEGVVPEIPNGVNRQELGNLKLSDGEEDDIVAFLETLSDGYSGAGGR